MKSDILINEVNLIVDKSIKEFTIRTLENAPDYFYKAMASSTGKYHPTCTNKEGGLIIHVKRATYIVNRLCDGYGIKDIDRDIVLSAIILHDIAKVPSPKENPQITYADYENHPINAEKYWFGEKETIELGIDNLAKITNCIRYHMGLWTPQFIKKGIKDYTLLELIVYTADYIATTKDLITPKDN